eukprot:c15438_g1_i2.p1 GENE.c15438_g1_i2~~c15438_g1_i2.p1  ORF type:complete len:146 (-),score=14.60 c15438_g1_i2:705-1142(-)
MSTVLGFAARNPTSRLPSCTFSDRKSSENACWFDELGWLGEGCAGLSSLLNRHPIAQLRFARSSGNPDSVEQRSVLKIHVVMNQHIHYRHEIVLADIDVKKLWQRASKLFGNDNRTVVMAIRGTQRPKLTSVREKISDVRVFKII